MIRSLHSDINPSQLKLVREYRGYTQTKLCKEIKGLSQSNLSKFEKGLYACLSEEKLREIMNHLEWPFDFLCQKINIKF